MNLGLLLRHVGDFVPNAKSLRVETNIGVHALFAVIAGKTRSVQFTAAGLYPDDSQTQEVRSELNLASDIARELRK
jgi:hypothetical protein